MTVPVQVPFSSSTASGSTTVFPFNFKIAAAADLSVTLNGVLQTTGYTVSGVGETAGGDVTFLVAPPNGTKVVRFLNPVLNRSVDYQQFGDWNSPVVNLDFDRLWLAMQMLNQNTNRSLKLPVDTAANQEITQSPAARANKGIKFDSDGNLTVSDYDPDEAQTASAANVAAAQLAADAAAAAMAAFDGESILPIEFGGTGADTAAGARTALGLGSAAVKNTGATAGSIPLFEDVSGFQTPAGAICHFAMSSAPSGWLKANGAAISRTSYASLFAAIGTLYGVGNGTTTFNLPDLRGEFIRGFDDSKGIDSGRSMGSSQSDEFKSHSHSSYTQVQNGATGGSGYLMTTGTTGAVGGSETRPRNVALLACIKY